MRYYAIADLHGRFDLLKEAHRRIKEYNEGKDCKIITLGDYIDRGPQSRQIIEYLIENQSDNFISLKGNHEDILVQSITHNMKPDWWVSNGGDTTLQSYGWGGEPYSEYAYEVVPKSHIDWMKNLPYFYETEHHLFVHAGIPDSGMKLPPKNAHKYEDFIWMLYDKRTAGGWRGKHVVHGHHQFEDGPHEWLGKDGGRTDLDTWAYRTGRLVVGMFDGPGKAKYFIEVKA